MRRTREDVGPVGRSLQQRCWRPCPRVLFACVQQAALASALQRPEPFLVPELSLFQKSKLTSAPDKTHDDHQASSMTLRETVWPLQVAKPFNVPGGYCCAGAVQPKPGAVVTLPIYRSRWNGKQNSNGAGYQFRSPAVKAKPVCRLHLFVWGELHGHVVHPVTKPLDRLRHLKAALMLNTLRRET